MRSFPDYRTNEAVTDVALGFSVILIQRVRSG